MKLLVTTLGALGKSPCKKALIDAIIYQGFLLVAACPPGGGLTDTRRVDAARVFCGRGICLFRTFFKAVCVCRLE